MDATIGLQGQRFDVMVVEDESPAIVATAGTSAPEVVQQQNEQDGRTS